MNFRQEIKRWLPIVVVTTMIVVLVFIWYFAFPESAWEGIPNYLQMYVEFVVTRPVNAFLTVNTGPGGTVAWVFVPVYLLIIAHLILYFVGRWKKQEYTVVTRSYLVYIIVLGLFAISFQNASQYYGWYWNPELNAPGYVDTWTHITSPWLLGALIAPLALERFLGWSRKFMWFFIFAVLMITALGWEIGETFDVYLDPSHAYFNYPMDSLKDMIMGAGVGTVLSCFIYERLVIELGE